MIKKPALVHRKRGELEDWCRANWQRIPLAQRGRCLNALRPKIRPEDLELFRSQHAAGEPVGTGDPMFHHGYGMQVRNELRHALPDAQLPPVVGPEGGYPAGEEVRNWDDFYTGALEQLCEETPAAAKAPRRLRAFWWIGNFRHCSRCLLRSGSARRLPCPFDDCPIWRKA